MAEDGHGVVHGRLDHMNLGKSMHQVGHCLSRTCDYTGARPWYERAVAEKEQGDVHGRVDHASLRTSLEALAFTLRRLDREAEAEAVRRGRARRARVALRGERPLPPCPACPVGASFGD